MNVRIEDDSKKQKNMKIFYITIITICIIAIIATLVIQIAKENKPYSQGKNETSTGQKPTEILESSEYKEKFYSIFENKTHYLENNAYKIDKIDDSKEIIYVGYANNESKTEDYDLDVNIPYINIKSDVIEEFNKQIKDVFEQKARSVLNTANNNIIYTVNYSAYISNNILSLVVRSTLKEGGNPQREIVQTYNYDLENQKICTIDELLELKQISKKDATQKIKDEIKEEQQRVEELANLGYTVYQRDYTSDIYNVNNATEYFLGENNTLYIVYAYGNENNTSEMDIIIM